VAPENLPTALSLPAKAERSFVHESHEAILRDFHFPDQSPQGFKHVPADNVHNCRRSNPSDRVVELFSR
jgi:hypothetical protein